ncbi:hypothetical protein MJG53_008740 [Ovis ammon polii x Ovis aries]|uniref:Uncharacterized protein n=1 Tax=Ovis ammon polii x Ovis aries TaxID=2918886 RepID=A0ACB9V1A3_9CETA|nr:hypothetical protein MJG53_008740 [Ovis ammon polii x Ovis aries]
MGSFRARISQLQDASSALARRDIGPRKSVLFPCGALRRPAQPHSRACDQGPGNAKAPTANDLPSSPQHALWTAFLDQSLKPLDTLCFCAIHPVSRMQQETDMRMLVDYQEHRCGYNKCQRQALSVKQSKVLRHKLGTNQTVFSKDISRMPEAHGKARLENQVKMLIMGTKMLRRQARREEKVLGKRKEVEGVCGAKLSAGDRETPAGSALLGGKPEKFERRVLDKRRL